MAKHGAEVLTVVELRHVLCNPERFALKENCWYAVNAPQSFVRNHPRHALAARVSATADHLASVASGWLADSGEPILLVKRATSMMAALNCEARLASTRLEISLKRTRTWKEPEGESRRRADPIRRATLSPCHVLASEK